MHDGDYSTAIVEDLLRGTADWKNTPDIIRLAFKALTEVVKTQGQALREVNTHLPTVVTRSELQSLLSQKADYVQVSEQVADLRANLENRSVLLDLQTKLDEKCRLTTSLTSLTVKLQLTT